MNGVINVYKPKGITSFDVVRQLKRILKTGKIGHTGTLDPLATGVLPVCVGKATKIVDFLMEDFKVYKATLKLGVTTDTYDSEGSIISERAVNCMEDEIITVINSFIGEIDQVPPMYSALKVNGKRLYELARSGIEIERESRKITIYEIIITDVKIPDVSFQVKCSKGTYIRSLCYDIGEKLGCGATMTALERTATGKFTKEHSVTLEELEKDATPHIIEIEDALDKYDKAYFNDKFSRLLINGVKIKDREGIASLENGKIYRCYDEEKFLGLGLMGFNEFKMIKLLI